jgi:hypothetical protein
VAHAILLVEPALAAVVRKNSVLNDLPLLVNALYKGALGGSTTESVQRRA